MRGFFGVGVALSASLTFAVIAGAPAQAEIGPGASPETFTGAPLPTYQTNGTVWDIAVVNGVVYVGGNFTKVRPPGAAPGTNEVTRNRLAAFNAQTGELLTWAPSARSAPWPTTDTNCTPLGNGQAECAAVWSITPTPDNRWVVIGGDFQTLDQGAGAQVRAGLAAFSTCTLSTSTSTSCATGTGLLNTTFKPSVWGRIYSVAATNSAVYIGGLVTMAAGRNASGVAAVDFPAGTSKAGFTPPVVVNGSGNGHPGIRKLVVTADGARLIVGGGYDSLNGRAIHGLQAVNAATGQSAAWEFDQVDKSAFITNLKIYDNVLYTNGEAWGSANEGVIALDAATGRLRWSDGCRGASHSMAMARGVIYVGSHAHDCEDMEGGHPEQYNNWPVSDGRRYTLRAEVPNGSPSAKLLAWSPRTNDGNGARAMQFDGANLWVGGEFTSIDSAPQQGLTRFGFLGAAQNHRPLKPPAPIATSTRPGVVDIAIQETEDPDNRQLKYELIRDGNTASPIYTATRSGPPWARAWMHLQDNVGAGTTHTYDVRATDPLGVTSSRSDQAIITAASTSPPLAGLVKADGAVTHHSFESRTNGLYVDSVAGKTATPGGSGVTTSPGNGYSGNAVTFSGSGATRGVVVQSAPEWTTRQFSVETLFKTSTQNGGSMVSLGSINSTSATSPNDMGLYMDNSGRLNFGLQPHAVRPGPLVIPTFTARPAVTTPAGYADNAWHHAVATFQPTGARIYVDGNLAAEDPTMTWTMPINAYLRLGADYVQFFPNKPSSDWFAGTLDEVATYQYPLSAAQVKAHSAAAFQTPTAPAPSTPTGLRVTGTTPTSVSLAWNSVSGATDYVISRGGSDLPAVTGTSVADTGRASGTSYSYTVRARNAAGSSPPSAPVTATTDVVPQPPAVPTGLRVTRTTSTTVSLAWDAVSGATDYVVSRGGSDLPAVTGTSLADTGRAAGTSYSYTVRARNAAGSSPPSAPVTATTDVVPQPPAVPTGLRVTGTTSTTVSLAWDAVSGATDYVVSRDGTALPAVTGTSLTDAGRTAASTYRYSVVARNAVGSSQASGTVTATTAGGQVASYSVSGAVWRANDTGANLGTAWRAAGFGDASWKSGPSQLGYGDGDEATVVTWGANPTAKPITTYFRRTFDAGASISDVTALSLGALIDDGAVVYLNGTEIWRFNLPTGTITSTTAASRFIAGAEENLWRTISLPRTGLVTGVNTLAVEVHNDLPSSSDLTFDLELRPVR